MVEIYGHFVRESGRILTTGLLVNDSHTLSPYGIIFYQFVSDKQDSIGRPLSIYPNKILTHKTRSYEKGNYDTLSRYGIGRLWFRF